MRRGALARIRALVRSRPRARAVPLAARLSDGGGAGSSGSDGRGLLPGGCAVAFAGIAARQKREQFEEGCSDFELGEDVVLPEGAVSVTTETQAHLYAEEGNLSGLQQEIAEGADVEALDRDAMTPLMRAARTGQIEVCKWLLSDAKADLCAVDSEGWTAFFWAVEKGHAELAEVLLSFCGDDAAKKDMVRRVDKRGLNCVHLACWQVTLIFNNLTVIVDT